MRWATLRPHAPARKCENARPSGARSALLAGSRKDGAGVEPGCQRATPVSYTHLDVYKRQGVEHLLDLAGPHLEAGGDDHVLDPVGAVEDVLVVEEADVTGGCLLYTSRCV